MAADDELMAGLSERANSEQGVDAQGEESYRAHPVPLRYPDLPGPGEFARDRDVQMSSPTPDWISIATDPDARHFEDGRSFTGSIVPSLDLSASEDGKIEENAKPRQQSRWETAECRQICSAGWYCSFWYVFFSFTR